MREKTRLENHFSKIGRIRTNSDEIQKMKPLVFHSMIFGVDGFGRIFSDFQEFRKIGKIAEK